MSTSYGLLPFDGLIPKLTPMARFIPEQVPTINLSTRDTDGTRWLLAELKKYKTAPKTSPNGVEETQIQIAKKIYEAIQMNETILPDQQNILSLLNTLYGDAKDPIIKNIIEKWILANTIVFNDNKACQIFPTTNQHSTASIPLIALSNQFQLIRHLCEDCISDRIHLFFSESDFVRSPTKTLQKLIETFEQTAQLNGSLNQRPSRLIDALISRAAELILKYPDTLKIIELNASGLIPVSNGRQPVIPHRFFESLFHQMQRDYASANIPEDRLNFVLEGLNQITRQMHANMQMSTAQQIKPRSMYA